MDLMGLLKVRRRRGCIAADAPQRYSKATVTTDSHILIADTVTKYYLELKTAFDTRFDHEISLLATAGTLYAQRYIFDQMTLQVKSIVNIAKRSLDYEESRLAHFVLLLQIIITKLENPEMSWQETTRGCLEGEQDIERTVQSTRQKYRSEPLFSSVVREFMNSSICAPARRELSIKN
jgi:hypothetical protein